MRRLIRFGLLLVGGSVALLLLASFAMHATMGLRLRRAFDVPAEPVPIVADEATLERGRRLVIIGRCRECHGRNLGGELYIDDPMMGRVYASNLTAGWGGVGREYRDEDWVRAIRHGVRPDGRSLIVTPANYYYHLSDEDLGAIIAYLKSVPPVNSPPNRPGDLRDIGPLGRIFVTVFNPRDWLPAEKIAHRAPRPATPVPGPTADYGAYLWQAATCGVCHDAPTLAQELVAQQYTPQTFHRALRRGRTPSGRWFDNNIMPYVNTMVMTDDEIAALWHYLQALAPGGRP